MKKLKKWLEKIKDSHIFSFFSAPSHSRTVALIGLFILVVALPAIVVIGLQRTNLEQHASVVGSRCYASGGQCAQDCSKVVNGNYTQGGTNDCGGPGGDGVCCIPKSSGGGCPGAGQTTGTSCQPGYRYCTTKTNGSCGYTTTCAITPGQCGYNPPPNGSGATAPTYGSCAIQGNSYVAQIYWSGNGDPFSQVRLQYSTDPHNFNASTPSVNISSARPPYSLGNLSDINYYVRTVDTNNNPSALLTLSMPTCLTNTSPSNVCDMKVGGQATLGTCQTSCSSPSFALTGDTKNSMNMDCPGSLLCCADTSNIKNPCANQGGTCTDANSCTDVIGETTATECTAQRQVCCNVKNVITNSCMGHPYVNDNNGGDQIYNVVQKGYCFYDTYAGTYGSNKSTYTGNINFASNTGQNWVSSCTNMLTTANNVPTEGHIISQDLKNCQVGDYSVCCSPNNNPPIPTLPPGADTCMGGSDPNNPQVGFCVYPSSSTKPPYHLVWGDYKADIFAHQSSIFYWPLNCKDAFPNTHNITPNLFSCQGSIGNLIFGINERQCCVPNSSSAPGVTPPNNTPPPNNACPTGTDCATQPPCPGGNCGPGPQVTPGPVCTPGQATSIALSVKLPSIGTGQFENSTPLHPTRTGSVMINGGSGSSQQFTYNSTSGVFTTPLIDLGTNTITCDTGNPTISVKLDLYLKANAPITYGQQNQTITLKPIPGDINLVSSTGEVIGDGQININDYTPIIDCRNQDPNTQLPFVSGSTTIQVKCGDLMNFIDYQDGGTQGDEWSFNYNQWVKGFFQANGF